MAGFPGDAARFMALIGINPHKNGAKPLAYRLLEKDPA
jgi:hypothetical protein